MNNNRVIFKVFPEHRVIKAEINDCMFDAINEFNRKFLAHSTSSLALSTFYCRGEKFLMPNTYSVVVRCHPDDEFDEEKGKRLALDRLADKYTKSLNKHLDNILISLDKSLERLAEYLSDYEYKTMNN